MSNADVLPVAVLRRKAVVYVRQSTQSQVQLSATGVIRPLQSRRKPATWRPAMRTAESAYTGHSEVGILQRVFCLAGAARRPSINEGTVPRAW